MFRSNFTIASTEDVSDYTIEFTDAAGETEGEDSDGLIATGMGTGVLPAPTVWIKADSANNSVLSSMKRQGKGFSAKNLKSVHIS